MHGKNHHVTYLEIEALSRDTAIEYMEQGHLGSNGWHHRICQELERCQHLFCAESSSHRVPVLIAALQSHNVFQSCQAHDVSGLALSQAVAALSSSATLGLHGQCLATAWSSLQSRAPLYTWLQSSYKRRHTTAPSTSGPWASFCMSCLWDSPRSTQTTSSA
jgi:hypothetical protein